MFPLLRGRSPLPANPSGPGVRPQSAGLRPDTQNLPLHEREYLLFNVPRTLGWGAIVLQLADGPQEAPGHHVEIDGIRDYFGVVSE